MFIGGLFRLGGTIVGVAGFRALVRGEVVGGGVVVMLMDTFLLLSTFSYKNNGGTGDADRRGRGVIIGMPRFSTSDTCLCMGGRMSFNPHIPGAGKRMTYKGCLTGRLGSFNTRIASRCTSLVTCGNALLGTQGVVNSCGPRDGGEVTLFTR